MALKLDHLKALHKNATPEPWKETKLVDSDLWCITEAEIPGGIVVVPDTSVFTDPDDVEFIIELRNSFPALVEELEYWKRVAEQAINAADLRIQKVADDATFYNAHRWKGETVICGSSSTETFIASATEDSPDLAKALEDQKQNASES